MGWYKVCADNGGCVEVSTWRKSDRSDADCVEVSPQLLIRDSKTKTHILQVSPKFFANIKRGKYDL